MTRDFVAVRMLLKELDADINWFTKSTFAQDAAGSNGHLLLRLVPKEHLRETRINPGRSGRSALQTSSTLACSNDSNVHRACMMLESFFWELERGAKSL